MGLVLGARLAITDSGGIQEESTYLHIPLPDPAPQHRHPGQHWLITPVQLAASLQ